MYVVVEVCRRVSVWMCGCVEVIDGANKNAGRLGEFNFAVNTILYYTEL